MAISHETVSGTDVYGPGTFIDKNVLPVPQDARRAFEILASRTPGFNKNKDALDTFFSRVAQALCSPVPSRRRLSQLRCTP